MLSNKLATNIAAPLLVLLALGSCGEDGSEEGALDGRAFLLESAEGFEPLAGDVHLSFADGELHFSAGCNSHFGPFALRAGRLVVMSLGSTLIGCDPALQAQDEWLADFMTSSPRLELVGDKLTLTGEEATLAFLDREVADPDRPLAGTAWSVDTLIEGDTAFAFALPSDPTLMFGDDGTVEIDTTCNTASGNYRVTGSRITLTNIAYTEKACSGASASADAHLQMVLSDGTITFEIEAARLTLQRGDVGLNASAP